MCWICEYFTTDFSVKKRFSSFIRKAAILGIFSAVSVLGWFFHHNFLIINSKFYHKNVRIFVVIINRNLNTTNYENIIFIVTIMFGAIQHQRKRPVKLRHTLGRPTVL